MAHIDKASPVPKLPQTMGSPAAASVASATSAALRATHPWACTSSSSRRKVRPALSAAAIRHRVPTMFANRNYIQAGGTMSCGPNLVDNFKRAAAYVDRILRKASPSTMPVEQPTRLELVVNRGTVRALGVALPQSHLLVALVRSHGHRFAAIGVHLHGHAGIGGPGPLAPARTAGRSSCAVTRLAARRSSASSSPGRHHVAREGNPNVAVTPAMPGWPTDSRYKPVVLELGDQQIVQPNFMNARLNRFIGALNLIGRGKPKS